jgi:hypothetical protein
MFAKTSSSLTKKHADYSPIFLAKSFFKLTTSVPDPSSDRRAGRAVHRPRHRPPARHLAQLRGGGDPLRHHATGTKEPAERRTSG